MRFRPDLAPPAGAAGPPVVVCVRGGDVLVIDEDPGLGEPLYLGTLDDRPCWAVDAAADPHLPCAPLASLHGQVDDEIWVLAGRAVQLVAWLDTHRFCGRCAGATEPADGERARRCPACGLLAYPRLAPAVITLVERDGEALLARGRRFPVPMYSTLAGFVEPGETLEQAVAREVREEVGVEVRDLRYVGSQPWPFPHSLMVGFRCRWAGGDIAIDEAEIADAQWFRPDALPMIPPPMSIARAIIDGWLAEQAG